MHPALSVILFTVTSGAGFGLIFLLGLGWPVLEGPLYAFLACALAGGLAMVGLLSSTFHLGHPERAWRAFTQWRSSWLSREGVCAVLTLAGFGLYLLYWLYTGERLFWLGLIVAILAAITVFTTSMIYAQLKTVPSWHSFLTPLVYFCFALCSALLAAGAIGTLDTLSGLPVSILAAIALVIAWLVKALWWLRAVKIGFTPTGSDTGTATGLGKLGKVRLLESPHSEDNYLTREMVHVIGRKHANKLRLIALLFGAVLPLALCFAALFTGLNAILLGAGFISMLFGLIFERWLFFAEAKHAVSLYYS